MGSQSWAAAFEELLRRGDPPLPHKKGGDGEKIQKKRDWMLNHCHGVAVGAKERATSCSIG